MPSTFKRLAGPARLAGTAATLYTAPASTKTVIRQIILTNPNGGTDRAATLSIGTDGVTTRSLASARTITANGVPVQLYGPVVLAAAEIIQGFAAAADEVVYDIHGEEITV